MTELPNTCVPESTDGSSQPSLVEAYVAGDTAAEAQISDWAYKWAKPFEKSLGDECQDATQDALLEVGQALTAGRFRGDGPLEAFVARIVRFRCIDRLRRRAKASDERIDFDRLPTAAKSAFRRIQQRESVDELWSLFASSPAACRELWALILDGLSYQEMSDRLGVRPGTLRVRVARCRQWAIKRRRPTEGAATTVEEQR